MLVAVPFVDHRDKLAARLSGSAVSNSLYTSMLRGGRFSHLTHLFSFSFPEFLRVRSHDPEEAIRHDVIVSIVTAAKKDLSLVNDALLNFVKERTLDKRVSGQSFCILQATVLFSLIFSKLYMGLGGLVKLFIYRPALVVLI